MTLRCTRRLLRKLATHDASTVTRPTTTLGDWYANYYEARPHPVVLCLNERSLVPVFVQWRELGQFVPAFRASALRLINRLGASDEAIRAERDAMSEIAIGPTANRRVLGCLNELAFWASVDFDWIEERYFSGHEDHFSRFLYSTTQHRRPCELALELLQAAKPLAGPPHTLFH